MLYRLYCLFNVSKRRAATVAILCAIVGFAMIPLGSDFASVTAGMFIWGMIYGCIWFFKFNRDRNIVRSAELQAPPVRSSARARGNASARRRATAGTLPRQASTISQQMAEPTSPGSSRLFVPQPLDRRQQ